MTADIATLATVLAGLLAAATVVAAARPQRPSRIRVRARRARPPRDRNDG
jgi:hypothetical protein